MTNYLQAGEFRASTLPQLTFQPSGCIDILQVTILGGGFLMQALHSPTTGLANLVIIKTALDLGAHPRERDKYGQPAAPIAPTA